MDAQVQQPQSSDTTSPNAVGALEGTKPTQPVLPPASRSSSKWQQTGTQVSDFLAKLPESIGSFFKEYQQLIIATIILFASIIGLRVILAVLDAVNDIPFVYPIFELIGICYTTWFVFRYLIKASTRQELVEQFRSMKSDSFGEQNTTNQG